METLHYVMLRSEDRRYSKRHDNVIQKEARLMNLLFNETECFCWGGGRRFTVLHSVLSDRRYSKRHDAVIQKEDMTDASFV